MVNATIYNIIYLLLLLIKLEYPKETSGWWAVGCFRRFIVLVSSHQKLLHCILCMYTDAAAKSRSLIMICNKSSATIEDGKKKKHYECQSISTGRMYKRQRRGRKKKEKRLIYRIKGRGKVTTVY